MIGSLTLERFADLPLEFGSVVRDEVGWVAVLRVAPPCFDRVEFRGVSRQPLEFDLLEPRSQDLFGRRPMHTPTIQHDDQEPAKPLPQFLDERHRLGSANV